MEYGIEYVIGGATFVLVLILGIKLSCLTAELDFDKKTKEENKEKEKTRNKLIDDVIYGTPIAGYFFTRENPLSERVELLEERLSKLEEHLKIKYVPKREEDISAHYKKKK